MRKSAFGPFKRRLLFGRFFKNYPWSPLCATVLLAVSNEAYFLGEFLKICLGPPLALFQKMQVFCDHAKIAITWQFVHSLSRFLRQNLAKSLRFKSMLIVG